MGKPRSKSSQESEVLGVYADKEVKVRPEPLSTSQSWLLPPANYYASSQEVFTSLTEALHRSVANGGLLFPATWSPDRETGIDYLRRCALLSVQFYPHRWGRRLLRNAFAGSLSSTQQRQAVTKLLQEVGGSLNTHFARAIMRDYWSLVGRNGSHAALFLPGHAVSRVAKMMFYLWEGTQIAEQLALEAFAASICGGVPDTLRNRLLKLRHLAHTDAREDAAGPVLLRLYLVAWANSGLPGLEHAQGLRWQELVVCQRCGGHSRSLKQVRGGYEEICCGRCQGKGVVPAGLDCKRNTADCAITNRPARSFKLVPSIVLSSNWSWCPVGPAPLQDAECEPSQPKTRPGKPLFVPCGTGSPIPT